MTINYITCTLLNLQDYPSCFLKSIMVNMAVNCMYKAQVSQQLKKLNSILVLLRTLQLFSLSCSNKC
jgi:hypothetical protein